MICFPNAKINLGLHITGKRSDGYHNLQSIFLPVDLHDSLEIQEVKEFKFHIHEAQFDGKTEDNLVVRAFKLLKDKYSLPPIEIHLLKNIPSGAGLGGGSSDAAFMLKLLNDYFKIGLNHDELKSYALKLGSDCPFFIDNKASFVEGRGEHLFQIKENTLIGKWVILLFPNIHISTQVAFSGIKNYSSHLEKDYFIDKALSLDNQIKNDFEKGLFDEYLILKSLKESLLENGAEYASLTGSGSVVYGIYNEEPNLNDFNRISGVNYYKSRVV